MSLTRLSNLISSTEGRFLYVDPNEFNASDLITNRGNSPTRPFKTIQRALLEVARFSYIAGPERGNDKYDQFTILLSPGDHWIDNRPGYFVDWDTTANYWDTDQQLNGVDIIPKLTDQSNFNIFEDNNDLFKFNSYEGGVIIPRGTSLVGSDLRKTRIRPRYVPDPMYAEYLDSDNTGYETSDYKVPGVYIEESSSRTLPRAAFFRVTGGCYFWQFSIFDSVPTSTGGVFRYASNDAADTIKFTKYTSNYEWNNQKQALTVDKTTGLGSHHKLTGFAFANGMSVPDITLNAVLNSATAADNSTEVELNKINSGSQARIHMGDYLLIDNATNANREIVRVKKVDPGNSKIWVYRNQLGTTAPASHPFGTTVTKLNDLGLYYAKVARGFSDTDIEDAIVDAEGEVEARQQENRIVGPLNVDNTIEQIVITEITSGRYKIVVKTRGSHGLFKNQIISLKGLDPTETSQGVGFGGDINGTVFVTSVLSANEIECEKDMGGTVTAQTYLFNTTAAATLVADIDTVDSASPYIFNCSIRSVFGICGMFCDGSKATGFKSMVVAQYTGVSLQKDDRAFVKYMYQKQQRTLDNTDLKDPAFLTEGQSGFDRPSDPNSTTVSTLHSDGGAYYQDNWRTFHIHIRYEGLIQAVSVFAVGFCDHHLIEDGGDISITNSNSNFGNTALRAVGFREKAFPQDKTGKITHIIPPQKLDLTNQAEFKWYPFDVKKVQEANTSASKTKLYLYNALSPTLTPTYTFDDRYLFGGKENEDVSMELNVGGFPVPVSSKFATNTDAGGSYEHIQSKGFVINPNTDVCTLTNNDSHQWRTGTPVRLESETGYLPDGLEPNTIYYIITENGGRWGDLTTWQDTLSGSGNIDNRSNQFKIAKTIEEARNGTALDLRTDNPPKTVNANTGKITTVGVMTVKQLVSDVKPIPIMHEFVTQASSGEFITVNDAAASGGNWTEIPHGYDKGQPIFFSKGTSTDTLPNLASGALSRTDFYYAYPTTRTRFKIAATQSDADLGINLITLGAVSSSGSCRVYANNGQWNTTITRQPLMYDPSRRNLQAADTATGAYGNWIVLTRDTDNEIIDKVLTATDYSGDEAPRTTPGGVIKRVKDVRSNYDRTYRYRYVLPKDNRTARPPFLGYVVKLRTDSDGYVMDDWDGGASSDYTQYARTYYIYDITEVQDFIPQVQDGVYYLTLLLADIQIDHDRMIRGNQGNIAQNWFKKYKFSQNTAELYPALDADNPKDNPDAAKSVSDHKIHGWVYSDSRTKSVTRECAEAFLADNRYQANEINGICEAREGFARRGREDQSRLFQVGYLRGNSTNRTEDDGIFVELRRPSLVRSGNHTFEYVGYGPGNYSTAFPAKQQRDLNDREVVVSQSKKEDAGVVFYSGLNSQGDLYVGTQKINAVTGKIEIIDESILEISAIPPQDRPDPEDEGEEGEVDRTMNFWDLDVWGKLTVDNGDEDKSTRIKGSIRSPSIFRGGVEFNTPRQEQFRSTQRVTFYGMANGWKEDGNGAFRGIHDLSSSTNYSMRGIYIDTATGGDKTIEHYLGDSRYKKSKYLWAMTTRPASYSAGVGEAIENLVNESGIQAAGTWSLGETFGDIAYKPSTVLSSNPHNEKWIYLDDPTGAKVGWWFQAGLTRTGGLYPFEDTSSSGSTGTLGINAENRNTARLSELYVKGSAITGTKKRDYVLGIDSDTSTAIMWIKKTGTGSGGGNPGVTFFKDDTSPILTQMSGTSGSKFSFEIATGHPVSMQDEVSIGKSVYIASKAEFLDTDSGIRVPATHGSSRTYKEGDDCFFSVHDAVAANNNVYKNFGGSGFSEKAPSMFDEWFQKDIRNQALPVGSIIMWNGAGNALPDGYVLCNGSTYTDRYGSQVTAPDLQNKFVRGGTGTSTGGANGGYDSHTVDANLNVFAHELTRPEVPAHSHGINHNYFRHTHDIQVQVGLNDLIGAAAGSDNPDAAFGTQWGSAAHTLVTQGDWPNYDGQNSQSNKFPGSNQWLQTGTTTAEGTAFVDLAGKGSMRTGAGTGGSTGGGGSSTAWVTRFNSYSASPKNAVELTGGTGGGWSVTYGCGHDDSGTVNVNRKLCMIKCTQSAGVNNKWDSPVQSAAVTVEYLTHVQTNAMVSTGGWQQVFSGQNAANYVETTYALNSSANAHVNNSNRTGSHYVFNNTLRALNPYNPATNQWDGFGPWFYWGPFRFKSGTQTEGYRPTIQFNQNGDLVIQSDPHADTKGLQLTFNHDWVDNPGTNGIALGTYAIASLGLSLTYNNTTTGSNTPVTVTIPDIPAGQSMLFQAQISGNAQTNFNLLNPVSGLTWTHGNVQNGQPGIGFMDNSGSDNNQIISVEWTAKNPKFNLITEEMTWNVYNKDANTRYTICDFYAWGGLNNSFDPQGETTTFYEIKEETLSGGTAGSYTFYYNNINVGTNTNGATITSGSWRYTMGSLHSQSGNTSLYEIKVEEQVTSSGTANDGWHDFASHATVNSGTGDPRRPDADSNKVKNAGNTLGRAVGDFRAFQHHHPIQFSAGGTQTGGVSITTNSSGLYSSGVNAYGSSGDTQQSAKLLMTLDNKPAYHELCYMMKV